MKKYLKEQRAYDTFYNSHTKNVPLKVRVYNEIVDVLSDSDDSMDEGTSDPKTFKKKLLHKKAKTRINPFKMNIFKRINEQFADSNIMFKAHHAKVLVNVIDKAYDSYKNK